MKLHILGSSSSGNCYILDGEQEALIIEAGVPFYEVKKQLAFNLGKICGVVVSHRHNDHSKYVGQYISAGITVLSLPDVFEAKGIVKNPVAVEVEAFKEYAVGEFAVKSFPLTHDVPCAGYMVRHKECGDMIFITDTSHVPYNFPPLQNIIIEANYSDEVMDSKLASGHVNKTMRDRVLMSHLDLKGAKEFLSKQDLSTVNNIVLAHLSNTNSDAHAFRDSIIKSTGKNVLVADKNMVINWNKTPF